MLNSSRQLWHSAFGPDSGSLGNPTEGLLEQCNRSVVILHAMLEKHGHTRAENASLAEAFVQCYEDLYGCREHSESHVTEINNAQDIEPLTMDELTMTYEVLKFGQWQ